MIVVFPLLLFVLAVSHLQVSSKIGHLSCTLLVVLVHFVEQWHQQENVRNDADVLFMLFFFVFEICL